MTCTRKTSLAVATAVLLLGRPCDAAEPQVDVAGLVEAAMARDARVRGAASAELKRARDLFEQLLAMDFDEAGVRDAAKSLGFDLVVGRDADGREVRVVFQADRRDGGGVYAVRPRAEFPVLVQAPHGFYDRHTRELCTCVFEQSDILAASWNSSHRRNLDVAHQATHFFQEFTAAVVASQAVTVVQLHGFSGRGRRSAAAREADVIVSNGTRLPSLATRRVMHRMQENFPEFHVHLFPWSVDELGATTNVQAALVRSHHDDEFVSLEFSAGARDQLRSDSRKISKLTKTFLLNDRNKSIE
jgi:hypothetical protein